MSIFLPHAVGINFTEIYLSLLKTGSLDNAIPKFSLA